MKSLAIILFVSFRCLTFAQSVNFQIRVDELYSESPQDNAASEFTWKFKTKIGSGSYGTEYCFTARGEEYLWYSYPSALSSSNSTNIIFNGTVTPGITTYTRWVNGFEDDVDGRCDQDGRDDYKCSTEQSAVVITYDLVANKPGEWIRPQTEEEMCSGDGRLYSSKISYMLAPPAPSSITLKDPAGNSSTNYCQGQTITLGATSAAYDNSANLVYVWQYNLNNETYVVSSTCQTYGPDANCDGYPDGPANSLLAQARGVTTNAVAPPDGGCEVCVEWSYVRDLFWRSAGETSFGSDHTIPVTSGGDQVKYRVAIRNATTGITGSFRQSASVRVYQAPPVFPALAPSDGAAITLITEAVSDNSFMKVDHVKCSSGNTGKISIKGISGTGRYYYNLRRLSDGLVQNINADGWGSPSANDPVVFPDEAANSFPLTAGAYKLIVENIESPPDPNKQNQRLCYSETNIVIRQPAAVVSGTGIPIAQSSDNPFTISCFGATDGRADITGSGGVQPYTYTLGTGLLESSSTVRFAGLAAGKHAVNIKDAFQCATDIQTEALTQPEALTINAPVYEFFGPNNEYTISCNGGTGSIAITTNGDDAFDRVITMGDTIINIDEETDAAVFNLSKSKYKIEAKYPHGCATTVGVELKEPTPIEASIDIQRSPSCLLNRGENDDDGFIQFNISGGIQSAEKYTSYLSYNDTNKLPGDNPIFTDLFANPDYDLVVSDEYCTATISDFELPVTKTPIRFDGEAIIVEPSCNTYDDGSISIKATNGIAYLNEGYSFSINGVGQDARSIATIFNNGIEKGSYVIRVEDSKLCYSDTTVVVGEPQPIAVLFDITRNICRGDSLAQIDARIAGGASPYTTRWTNVLNNAILEEVVPAVSKLRKLPRGDYNFLVKDDHGCTNLEADWYTLTKTIIDPDTLKVRPFFLEDISCYGASDGYVSVTASGGWGSFKYSSDSINFSTTNEFTGVPPGSNKFFVKDLKGCVRSTSQFVNEPAPLEVVVRNITDAQCFEFSNGSARFQVTGGTGPYYISPGVNEPWIRSTELSGLKANLYTVQVKDDHQCAEEINIEIKQPLKLELNQPLPSVNSTCSVANGQAEVIASGGIAPYIYTWYNADNDTINTTSFSSTLLSGVYRVTVNDKNQCLTPLEVEVSDEGAPMISDPDITIPSCSYSSDGAIDLTISAGTLPYAIRWSNNATTEDISGLAEEEFRLSVVDGNNCKVFRSFIVDAPEPLDVIIDELKDPTCFESSDAFIDVSFIGGNGGYTYKWSNESSTDRIELLKAGVYTIALNDSKGCVYEETYTIKDPKKLTLGLVDRTICVGQTHAIELPVANGTYQWTSDNGFTSDQRSASVSKEGVYFVHVVDEKGCIADEQFELKTSTDLLNADFLVLQQAHVGDTIVAIDITWPLPDVITWNYDSLPANILYEGQDYTEFTVAEPGTYSIAMHATLGQCYDNNVQQITILGEKEEDPNSGGRKRTPVITSFTIFPNPNDGKFTVEIELSRDVPGSLRMISLSGNRKLIDYRLESGTSFSYEADLGNLVSGVYFIMLEAGGEQKIKRVVIE